MTGSAEVPSGPPPPGWYFDGVGMRWWSGTSWGPYAPGGPTGSPVDAMSTGSVMSVLPHVGFFVLSVVLPLVIRQTEGKKSEFVRHHSTEALNFQLTFLAVWLSGFIAIVTIAVTTSAPDGSVSAFIALPFVLMFGIFAGGAAMSIVGAVRANRGEWWRYPLSIRFVPGARGPHE